MQFHASSNVALQTATVLAQEEGNNTGAKMTHSVLLNKEKSKLLCWSHPMPSRHPQVLQDRPLNTLSLCT